MLKANSGIFIGLIMIAISFVIFPIVIEGANTILGDEGLANYTGLESVVKIAPMIVFVGLLFGGMGVAGYSAYKRYRARRSGRRGR